jgi:hypothetical protein
VGNSLWLRKATQLNNFPALMQVIVPYLESWRNKAFRAFNGQHRITQRNAATWPLGAQPLYAGF